MRENLVGSGFLDPPSIKKNKDKQSADTRITVLGEIVSATGFNAENLYIYYDTMVSEGWTFEDANEYENFGTIRDLHTENNKRWVIDMGIDFYCLGSRLLRYLRQLYSQLKTAKFLRVHTLLATLDSLLTFNS